MMVQSKVNLTLETVLNDVVRGRVLDQYLQATSSASDVDGQLAFSVSVNELSPVTLRA